MPQIDMTDQYNTKLSEADEAEFQKWAAEHPRLANTFDYDARGFWKAGAGEAANGHGSDEFKKPNHPTFSTGSMYSGVDGYQGGEWAQSQNGSYSFTPSETNLQNLSPSEMMDYFQKVESGNRLVIPSPDP